MKPRLLEKYKDVVFPELQKRFNYKNIMQVPKITKITINMGVGKAHENRGMLDTVIKDLGTATGQLPVVTKARISVANFKVRAGMSVGCMVTLRGPKMYEFFDKMISIVIPRIKDFRGLNPDSFDLKGNYTFGFADQLVFPEIDPDAIQFNQGMSVSVTTNARTPEEARVLLEMMGMPFRREALDDRIYSKKSKKADVAKKTTEKKQEKE